MRMQEKEQHRFFLGLNTSTSDRTKNDGDEEDTQSDISPPKNRHEKNEPDP